MTTNEHTEQSERAEFTPDPLEQIIDNYVSEYEFNDGEAFHAPTEEELFMIKDAIMGLIADQAFDAEWGKAIDEQAERKVASMIAADKAGGEVAQWQKRHPDIAAGCWSNTNEADAKWWRDNAHGWEVRALYARPQQAEAVRVPDGFPPRIMALLCDVADRNGTEQHGPWQDGNGEPLQDDADAALAWIAAMLKEKKW